MKLRCPGGAKLIKIIFLNVFLILESFNPLAHAATPYISSFVASNGTYNSNAFLDVNEGQSVSFSVKYTKDRPESYFTLIGPNGTLLSKNSVVCCVVQSSPEIIGVDGYYTQSWTVSSFPRNGTGTYRLIYNNGTLTFQNDLYVRVSYSPIFSEQPASITTAEGASAVLSTKASAYPLITKYQWYFSDPWGKTVPLPNTNSATLTLNDLTSIRSGEYWVVATNSTGSSSSSKATVTVTFPTREIQALYSLKARAGETAGFNWVVESSAKPSATFTFGGVNVSGSVVSCPEFAPSSQIKFNPKFSYCVKYTTPALVYPTDHGKKMKMAIGQLTSNEVLLTVFSGPQNPKIVSCPDPVKEGGTFSFDATVESNPPSSLLWILDNKIIDTAINPNFKITYATRGLNGKKVQFQAKNCVPVTGSSSCTTSVAFSNECILQVKAPPMIKSAPISNPGPVISPGQTAVFSFPLGAIIGITPLTYVWKINEKNVSNFISESSDSEIQKMTASFSGANGEILTLTQIPLSFHGSRLTAEVANSEGTTVSPTLYARVGSSVVITKDLPTQIKTMAGSPVSFSVVAIGPIPLSYRWQRCLTLDSGCTDIPGFSVAAYTLVSASIADSGNYRVIVKDTYGHEVRSSTAVLWVGPRPLENQGILDPVKTQKVIEGWSEIQHTGGLERAYPQD